MIENKIIKFEDFFKVDNPEIVKVKFNMNAGDVSKKAWDLLKSDDPEWILMNAHKKKQANNNLNHAKYLLAFAQYYPLGNEYFIFGGFYKVEKIYPEVFNATGYKLELLDQFSEYRKRLIIKLNKAIGRDIYNKPYLSVIRDFSPEIYELSPSSKIENFNGFNRVCLTHSDMQYIFNNEAPEWKINLSSVKAVYCITDISNGQIYIGSAYGEGGLWQRWSAYANVKNLTGGNKAFEKLKESGAGHIINNFTYSILEIFDIRTDKHIILQRENYWKDVFKTVKYGMNNN